MAMKQEEITYIAERYCKGRFSVDKAWHRLGIAQVPVWRHLRVAVAIASIVSLSAAALIVYNLHTPSSTHVEMSVEKHEATSVKTEIRMIDFEDVTLPTVISKIREVYGVEITDIPDNAADYRLSLHYEGNVADLLETINEILDTKMALKE